MNVDQPVHQQLSRALDLANQKKVPFVPFHGAEVRTYLGGVYDRLPEVAKVCPEWNLELTTPIGAIGTRGALNKTLAEVIDLKENEGLTFGLTKAIGDSTRVALWARAS